MKSWHWPLNAVKKGKSRPMFGWWSNIQSMVFEPVVSTPGSVFVSAVLWLLRIWKAATPDVTRPLIYSSKQAMIKLFLPSSAKKESGMKSIFGYIAGVRSIFGIGCCICILDYNHKRRIGSWSTMQRTEGPGNNPCWPSEGSSSGAL